MEDGFSCILDFPKFSGGGPPDPPFKGNTSIKPSKSLFNNNNCQTKKGSSPHENICKKFILRLYRNCKKEAGARARSRARKNGGYTGFALSFRHSVTFQVAPAYLSLYVFIFLSLQFSNIEIFGTLFWGNVRPRRLKLGTHMGSGQMYSVHRNQAALAYSSLYFFIFLSLQFSNIESFRHTFLRNYEA